MICGGSMCSCNLKKMIKYMRKAAAAHILNHKIKYIYYNLLYKYYEKKYEKEIGIK